MNSRALILESIKRNRPKGKFDLPGVPRFVQPEPEGRVGTFIKNLKLMGGAHFDPGSATNVLQLVREHISKFNVVCSAVPEIEGNRDLAAVKLPRELADVDVAVVRAALGVAETGSLLFTENELKVNTLAYLAQHLLVLLDPNAIVSGLQDAYDRAEFHRARYVVFHTGPSATGDIEGVLIHGAQGVRSLTVVLFPGR
jgi:L-lactate dehydrogenase complex protein LldG